jgi:hypothetical protein
MAAAPESSSASARPRRWWLLPLALVLLAAIAVRAAILFSSPLPPGMDAAYYPVQARSLLEDGRFLYHDLPLRFAIDAALSMGLMAVAKLDIDAATLLASRLTDTVLPPLVAVPIVLLGRRFARGQGDRWTALAWSVAAAALLATVSYPILRMTGDFQKNALGLVWLAAAAWGLHRALAEPRRVSGWCWTALAVGLAATTHVGAFGATAVLVAVALGTAAVAWSEVSVRRLALLGVGGTALAALALGAVWVASPERARALLDAPLRIFGMSAAASGAGPRAGGGLAWGGAALVVLIVGFALRRLWVERSTTPLADRAVVLAAGATAALLTCPLLSGEYLMRFALMAPVPLAIAVAYLLVRRTVEGRRTWPTVVVAGAALGSGLAGFAPSFLPTPPNRSGTMQTGERPPRGGPLFMQVVSDEGAAELRELRPLIPDPKRTLVVARHGLEWWAAFLLHTPVRQGRPPDDSFDRYERVLLLVERGPPHNRASGGPGPGPMRGPAIPSDATLLREGPTYRLFELARPKNG